MQAKPSPARRTKVKGKQGIYYRQVGKRRRYEITYLDSDGRRRWQTVPGFDNLDDAEAMLVEVKGKLNRGERIAPGKLTFNEAADMWFAGKNVAERTRERYESNLRLYLRPRFGHRRVHEISAEDVAALVAAMRADGKAGWTQRNVLTTLSGFFTWASSPRRRYAPANPVSQLEEDERPRVRKRKGRVLQPNEIKALLDSAPSDRYRDLHRPEADGAARIALAGRRRQRDLRPPPARAKRKAARRRENRFGRAGRCAPPRTRRDAEDPQDGVAVQAAA
jgi:hypothetical protein